MPTDEHKRQIVWLYPKHGHSYIESEVRKNRVRGFAPFGSMPTRKNGTLWSCLGYNYRIHYLGHSTDRICISSNDISLAFIPNLAYLRLQRS